MNGRLVLAGILVAAAYVKGRIDAAYEAERVLPAHDPIARAGAETAATLAPVAPNAAGVTQWAVAEAADVPVEPVDGLPAVEELRPGWRRDGDNDASADVPHAAEPHGAVAEGESSVEAPQAFPDGWDAPVASSDPSPLTDDVAPADAFFATEPVVGDADASPGLPAASSHEAAAPGTLAEGDFFVSGLASAAGDLAFGRVLFAERLGEAPAGSCVRLIVDASENLPEGGVAVMTDGGFAPCVEGMTLVAAAAAPGRFVARGRYQVAHPDSQ